MAQDKGDTTVSLGVFGRRSPRDVGLAEWVAAGVSVLWLIACIIFFAVMDGAGPDAGGAIRFVMVLLVVAVPVVVIWLAASAARSARIMREESQTLQGALHTMRQSFLEVQQAQALSLRPVEISRKLEEIAQKQQQTEDALATFVSARPKMDLRLAAPVVEQPVEIPAEESGQASLELETPEGAQVSPVDTADLIRAINFPENAEDAEGFSALRRALSDRKVASLIQAAQDVLTLLSQDGIYMDDLRPDLARPEIWRRFARGERGRVVAALGGIRDRSSLALTAGRMRHDTVFRDAGHHFLRRFDEVLTDVEPRVNDEDLARFAATRTARAFMLLGRVTGTFD